MVNGIISKTGLFAVAVGGIVGIGVGSQISELITKKQAAETETESLRQLLLELVAENHKLDTFLSGWQGGEQRKDRKIHELTTKQETVESEKKELEDALGELEEEIRKLEGDKGAEIKDLREKLTRSFKQLSDQQDEYKEGIITQHIMQKHSMEEAHKNQMLKMKDDHNHQMFQLTSRLSKQIGMLRGSNRKSQEANQKRIHELQIKYIAEVEQLKEEHRIEIAEHSLHENSDSESRTSEMRQQHKQQVQALNMQLEQLESKIQEIEQAYEKEEHDILSGVNSQISLMEQRYATMIESQQHTADVKEQDHQKELETTLQQYRTLYQEQDNQHAKEMSKASLAAVKMKGIYAQRMMGKENGKNKQIELLHQNYVARIAELERDHHAEMDDLRKDHLHEIQVLRHDISLTREDLLRHKSEFKTERNKNDTKQVQIDNHEKTIKHLETNAAVDDLARTISKVSLK